MKYLLSALSLILFLSSNPAKAINISVDPGAFQGHWLIVGSGMTDWSRGPNTLNLAPGSYDVWIGTSGYFSILVDGVGNVSSSNAGAAVGGPTSLVFQNSSITIDPAAYEGYVSVAHVTDFYFGTKSVTIIPGLTYDVWIGDYNGSFLIDVDASGNVQLHNAEVGTAVNNTITLNNVEVAFNPGAYTGNWAISHVTNFASGSQTVTLVPGVSYSFYLGLLTYFRFDVESDSTVIPENTNAAVGGLGSFTLNAVDLDVTPGNYSGYWKVAYVQDFLKGAQKMKIVPGVNYNMMIGSLGNVQISADSAGRFTSGNTAAIAPAVGKLTFANAQVYIDTGSKTEPWSIQFVNDYTVGPAYITIVPNLQYQVSNASGDTAAFTVTNSGVIAESTIPLGDTQVSFTPPPPTPPLFVDSDSDGVSDSLDLCPGTSVKKQDLAKQVDSDGCTKQQRKALAGGKGGSKHDPAELAARCEEERRNVDRKHRRDREDRERRLMESMRHAGNPARKTKEEVRKQIEREEKLRNKDRRDHGRDNERDRDNDRDNEHGRGDLDRN